VEERMIRDNRVAITPELIAAFRSYYQLLSLELAYVKDNALLAQQMLLTMNTIL
jgi:hypothetical protein